MYINTEVFQEKNSCEGCRHSSICRFCKDMKYKIDEVNSIHGEPLSPVRINVTCKNFERKNTKQDGIGFTNR